MIRKLGLGLAALTLAIGAGFAGFYMNQQSNTATTPQTQQAANTTPPDNAGIGSRRVDFSLADVDGKLRHIDEWDGKVVALNFWATWCPPCIKEIPEFVELQHKYADAGLQFIGIALQRPEEVIDFMAEKGMNYPVLAGEMEVIKIASAYGNTMGALPYTVIIDREGRIQALHAGPLSQESAEAIITKLL